MTTVVTPSAWVHEIGLDVRAYRHWWVDVEVGGPDASLYLSLTPTAWTIRVEKASQVSALAFTDSGAEVARDDLEIRPHLTTLARPRLLFDFLARQLAFAPPLHASIIRANPLRVSRVMRAWLLSVTDACR